MPAYWMISNCAAQPEGFGGDRGPLTFWVSDKGPLDNFSNWLQVARDDFKKQLVAAADQFPAMCQGDNEEQSHVTFFVHGSTMAGRTPRSVTSNFARTFTAAPTASACASALTGRRSGA